MVNKKWKVEIKILAETGERVWIVHRGKELHKDYLGRVMKFNSRENAERMAKYLNEKKG